MRTMTKERKKEGPRLKGKGRADAKASRQLLLLCIPAIIAYILFNYIPMGAAVIIPFKNYKFSKGILGSDWCGLANFKWIIQSVALDRALRNTVLYGLLFMVLSPVTNVIIALLLFEITSRRRLKTYQTIITFPNFMSMVIVGYIVYAILSPRTGLMNQIIQFFGGDPVDVYMNSKYWPFILTVVNIWKGIGMGEAEWYDIDGTYTHRIKHPQITAYLEYMQKLYKEGLMDNDMPINTADNAKEKFASANAVACAPLMFWDIPAMVNALATNNPDCKIEFVTDLAADANSKPTHYIMKGANFVSCISQSSKNPEHAINWLNILSEPDNYRRTYIGEEGVSYEVIDGNYTPIFTGDDATNFNAYTNSDKLSGINNPTVSFKMWQARARKTPEMAEAYEAMNARVDEYEPLISIELYGKTSPKVQEYVTALNQAFGDSFLKAIVEGTDPDTAIAAMQADWDANGGLEVEAAMQEFYDANKSYSE